MKKPTDPLPEFPSASTYFTAFLDRPAPTMPALSARARVLWQLTAAMTIGLGAWYLHWRWTQSLNPDALVFSVAVATAETLTFLGTLIFFFNIWDEGDSDPATLPTCRSDLNMEGEGDIRVGIFITTYDEDIDLVERSVEAAQHVVKPPHVSTRIFLTDDGNRPAMRAMAKARGVGYVTRGDNRGHKAGNLANALFRSDADLIVICDADTQLFPQFLERTLGYFRDPLIAYVQTPHWFYDIPEGENWGDWLGRKFGPMARPLAPLLRFASGRERIGSDPFLSGSNVFFDVIQRRRNRHNASFCCGAGSIHRAEAIFENALREQGKELQRAEKHLSGDCAQNLLPRLDMQLFRFHVSEDIFTSLQQHCKGWRSIYHPEVLARMLSPWSMDAWATQKLKYAGGTFDIMLRTNLIWQRGLPWTTRLHYLSTFWSYLSVLWMPVLFIAPMFSLLTGLTPVDAYSIEFFLHLLPLLLMNELAMSLGCKGHDIHAGRLLSLATLNIQMRALFQVLKGEKPRFPPTPKNPTFAGGIRFAMPAIATLAAMAGVAAFGVFSYLMGSPDHSMSLLVVNLFWMSLNALAFLRIVFTALWRPRLPDGSLLPAAI